MLFWRSPQDFYGDSHLAQTLTDGNGNSISSLSTYTPLPGYQFSQQGSTDWAIEGSQNYVCSNIAAGATTPLTCEHSWTVRAPRSDARWAPPPELSSSCPPGSRGLEHWGKRNGLRMCAGDDWHHADHLVVHDGGPGDELHLVRVGRLGLCLLLRVLHLRLQVRPATLCMGTALTPSTPAASKSPMPPALRSATAARAGRWVRSRPTPRPSRRRTTPARRWRPATAASSTWR